MDTNASFNENDELIHCCKSNITLIVEDITLGKGTLYVADSKLYWKKCNHVISINYQAMSDINVCDHPEIHEKPCLLIFFDLNYNTSDVDEDDQNEDEKEEEIFSSILLVPDSPECLNEIYEMITEVKSLEFRAIAEGSDRESNPTENESEEHEESDNDSHITSSSTFMLEDQETGSIDFSNESDAKNGVKENQDEEVLNNKRNRKFEDLPEQEEKPTKIRKLWNLMKHPFQKITSFDTSISENEPNISRDQVIDGKNNSLEPDTAVCVNNSDNVQAEEKKLSK